tara:strand:- start:2677 stop:2907 length:231 start_codon:yes stop_codon:yes gene_type:complete
MDDYAYNLTAIATHLKELAISISKKLDISLDDAWDLCIEKLETKFLNMQKNDNNDKQIQDRIKKTLFNDDCLMGEK